MQLYEAYPSLRTPLSAPELAAVRDVGDQYFAARKTPSAWQVDPLASSEQREMRAAALAHLGSLTLSNEYKAHRFLTRFFSDV